MRICPLCRLSYVDEQTHCLIDGARLEAAKDPRLGTIIADRYRLERVIGSGGMATVYAASNTLPNQRKVAVKLIHERFAHDKNLRTRVEREARSAATVAHPNVIEVYDTGITDDGVPYLVCELLEGLPLDKYMDQVDLGVDGAIGLGLQIARGLGRAHDLGVVHRDIKPENIFVCRSDDGEPVIKLVDFGLAMTTKDSVRLTKKGDFVGSPRYMAPERFSGQGASPAADLYSLGVVLYEMAAGQPPFVANSLPGYVLAHLETAPPSLREKLPNAPPPFDALITELLAKEPSNRPHDAHVVEARLSTLASRSARRVRKASALSVDAKHDAFGLQRWSERADTFQEMLDRVWPQGAPAELVTSVVELRGVVARLTALEQQANKLTGKLEHAEDALRQRREQLGRAVATIGEDLSAARARLAQNQQSGPAAWRGAMDRVHTLQAEAGDNPSEAVLAAMREATGAYGQWLSTWERSGVSDLEFQLQSLRAKLLEAEQQAQADRGQVTDQVRVQVSERAELERDLLRLSHVLTSALRPRPELRDLFSKLASA